MVDVITVDEQVCEMVDVITVDVTRDMRGK